MTISDQITKATQAVRKLLLPAWYLPNGTKNASENQLENGSVSCERWSIWCGILVIVCIIAEFVLTIIKPSYDLFLTLSAIPDAGVALGIIGEVGFGIWNNRIQTELRNRSNAKLSEAIKIAGDAIERAAVAEQKTAELQIKLRNSLMPRSPNPEKFLDALKGKPPAQIVEVLFADCPDCDWLASWITAHLTTAGWPVLGFARRIPDSLNPETGLKQAQWVGGQPWGVTVVCKSLEKDGPHRTLMSALGSSLDDPMISASIGDVAEGVLRVVVAPRP